MLPNFLLIGPGRAGSDWITKNLAQHPDIYIPRQKVTRFFNHNYEKGIDWYSKIFGNRQEKAVGESTVGYLMSEGVPERIAEHLPNVKLIANLRNPVDRTYSSYGRLTGMAKPGEPNYQISFEDKIEMTPRLIEKSCYGRQLKVWFEHFPQENFLIMTFDQMKSDPDAFLKSIYRFLEVDDSFESPLTHQRLNSTATVSSKSRLVFHIYRAMLRFGWFGPSRALDSVNRTERKSIDPETRQRLIEEVFLPDIQEVERLTGHDLTAWKS